MLSVADGKGSFPLVMVGGVLEGNKGWDIGKEVVKHISKVYPGVQPIQPKVCGALDLISYVDMCIKMILPS